MRTRNWLRIIVRASALLLVLLCVPLLAYAEETLTIQVIDCNDDPLSNVTILLGPPTSDPSIGKGRTKSTNSDGIVEFSDLLGSYTVSVACPGRLFSFVFKTETGGNPTLVIRCCAGKDEIVDQWVYVGEKRIPYESGRTFTEKVKKEWKRPFGTLKVHVMDCNNKDLSGIMVTLSHTPPPPPPTGFPPRPTANGYVTYRMLTVRKDPTNNYTVSVNCPPLFTKSPVYVQENGTTTVTFKCPAACSSPGGWLRTTEEWDGHGAVETPGGAGRREYSRELSALPPGEAPAGSKILATPVGFTGGTVTGVVHGPDGQPAKNVDLTITGTVESKAKTDDEGRFTIPVSGAVGSAIKVAGAGIATAAVVRIVENVGQAASSTPPAFVQPGEHVHLNGSYKRVQFQQNENVVETPLATATGPNPGQAVTTFETPQDAQPGEATWKTEDPNGAGHEYQSNVIRIVKKEIDERSLRSGQNAKFVYDIDFGRTMAGKEVEIGWTITGPIVLRDAAPKRMRIGADGHVSTGGQIKARPVAPGTAEPFTITPAIKALKKEKLKEEEAKKAAPAEEPTVDGDFLRDYKSAELRERTRVEQIIDYFEGKNPSIKFWNGEGKQVTWNPCVAPNVIKKIIRKYYVNDDGSKSYNSAAPAEGSQIWMENHSPQPGTRTGEEVYWICAKP